MPKTKNTNDSKEKETKTTPNSKTNASNTNSKKKTTAKGTTSTAKKTTAKTKAVTTPKTTKTKALASGTNKKKLEGGKTSKSKSATKSKSETKKTTTTKKTDTKATKSSTKSKSTNKKSSENKSKAASTSKAMSTRANSSKKSTKKTESKKDNSKPKEQKTSQNEPPKYNAYQTVLILIGLAVALAASFLVFRDVRQNGIMPVGKTNYIEPNPVEISEVREETQANTTPTTENGTAWPAEHGDWGNYGYFFRYPPDYAPTIDSEDNSIYYADSYGSADIWVSFTDINTNEYSEPVGRQVFEELSNLGVGESSAIAEETTNNGRTYYYRVTDDISDPRADYEVVYQYLYMINEDKALYINTWEEPQKEKIRGMIDSIELTLINN